MKKEPAVIIKNITKEYYLEKPKTLKNWFKNIFTPFKKYTVFNNFSLTVNKGDFLVINGPNGSGKTTLLKLIAGITYPDKGEIKTFGRVVPLIELGAGFNYELTGIENIWINGIILGIEKEKLKNLIPKIVQFSELEDFINIPLKRYSTGMITRLAFSIASYSEPDILLLDEIFAVGDERFRYKIMNFLFNFKKNKKTLILATNILVETKIFNKKIHLNKDLLKSENNVINIIKNIKKNVVFKCQVITPSMEPTIKVNSFIRVIKTSIKDVKVNDVILFFNNQYSYPIVHRAILILKEKNKLKIITKGDNNYFNDRYVVDEKNFIGKVLI